MTRDTKQYIAQNVDWPIPVGVTVDFGPELNATTFGEMAEDFLDYVSCFGLDANNQSSPDFFGVTDYKWCPGNGTIDIWDTGTVVNGTLAEQYERSGWEGLANDLSYSPIPAFFSGYGCIYSTAKSQTSIDRDFLDASALYDGNYMGYYFSGGFLWEYANVLAPDAGDNFGLVNIDREGNVQLRTDYDTFSQVLAQFNLAGMYGEQGSIPKTTNTPIACSYVTGGDGYIFPTATESVTSITFSIPTAPSGLQSLITAGAGGATGNLIAITKTSVSQTVRGTDGIITKMAITTGKSYTATGTPSVPTTTTGTGGHNNGTSEPVTKKTASSSGLSTGAKAGIAVGVIVVALAAACFLLYRFCYRPRHASRDHEAVAQVEHPAEKPPQELGSEGQQLAALAENRRISELPHSPSTTNNVSELGGGNSDPHTNGAFNAVPWELDASGPIGPMSHNMTDLSDHRMR